MKISSVKVFKLSGNSKLLGYSSVCLDERIIVKKIKIAEGKYGKFIGMPSTSVKKDGKTSYKDLCFFNKKGVDLRKELSDKVLNIYENDTNDENNKEITSEPLQFSNIYLRKIPSESKMKAVASVTVNDVLVINDLRLIEGSKGLFLSFPSVPYTKDGKTEYETLIYFLDKEDTDYWCYINTNKKTHRKLRIRSFFYLYWYNINNVV